METGSDCGTVSAAELHRSLCAGYLEGHFQVYGEWGFKMGAVLLALRSPRGVCTIQQEVVRSGSSKQRLHECSRGNTVPRGSGSFRRRQFRACAGLAALRAARGIGMGSEGQRHDGSSGSLRNIL